MTPPRLLPLDPPYAPEIADSLAAMMPPGVPPLRLFRTLAWNPRVLDKIRRGNLLDRGSLSRRDREIVILRTCARCGAEYEWGVHVAVFAEKVGISPRQVADTVAGEPSDASWSESDVALLGLVDALHDTARIDDARWTGLRRHFDEAQCVELLVLAGFYHTIAFVVNALGIEPEDAAARFPV